MEDFAFGAVSRAYGDAGLAALRAARVAVVGLGGVGSYAVEALARCGVGRITLIDLDEVCYSNLSRQAEATRDSTGELKADALADRVLAVNPFCRVTRVYEFLDANNCAELLSPPGAPPFDVVLDCLDDFTHKAEVVAHCVAEGVPVVTTGSAAGVDNPAAVYVADLGSIPGGDGGANDPCDAADAVALRTRAKLAADASFAPRGDDDDGVGVTASWGVSAVYCARGRNVLERAPDAEPLDDDNDDDGGVGVEGVDAGTGQDAWGAMSLDAQRGGALCFVTGTQGFLAAGEAVNGIVRRARDATAGGEK